MKEVQKRMIAMAAIVGVILTGVFIYLYYNGLSDKRKNTEPVREQIKVACVGDSITYGYGISNWKENNYPAVLQEILGEAYHVANFGFTGACVNPKGDEPYIEKEIYKESLEYDADILIFMLGTNDSKPTNWSGAENFMENYIEVLETYMNRENPPKLYIGVCAEAYFTKDDTDGTAGFDIQPAVVDEIAELLRQFSAMVDYPCFVIDIHALTEIHPEWFEGDGIHPDKNGAKAIAEAAAEALKAN